MATKTNAVRLLLQQGIRCKEAFYEYNPSDLSGLDAAQKIGKPPEEVFKTLVARGPRTGINVFCIPVCMELNLKSAASVAGDKSMELIPVKELLPVTGYIRGGCSPIGMKRKYPVYIDESALLWDEIAISAGERGHQMILPPMDLTHYLGAKLVDIT